MYLTVIVFVSSSILTHQTVHIDSLCTFKLLASRAFILKVWNYSLRRPAISHVYCMLKATLAFHCFEMIQTRNQKDSAWGWLWVAFEHLSNHAMLVEGNGVPCTMVPSSLEVKWIVDPGWPITCWADHNLEITDSSLHPSRYHPCLDTHAMDPSVIQVLLWILLLDVVLLI